MGKSNPSEWHWFKGGILVSLLSLASYFIFAAIAERNYPFGITAGYGFIAAQAGKLFQGLAENPVIQRFSQKPDSFIEFFTIIGLILGGFAASRKSGTYKKEAIPALWIKHHGAGLRKRAVVVAFGSALLGYGAALASGCTTGNILQGWAHLSLGSIVAGAAFFAGGIAAAWALFPALRRGR